MKKFNHTQLEKRECDELKRVSVRIKEITCKVGNVRKEIKKNILSKHTLLIFENLVSLFKIRSIVLMLLFLQ